MAAKDSDFFSGEDFDAILAALDEDEEFLKQIGSAVDDVTKCELVCDICQKKCKSKSGLTRHQIVHRDKENELPKVVKPAMKTVLTIEKLQTLMEEIVTVVSENGCYPDNLKSELNDNKVIVTNEFFKVVGPIYDNYHKNGNNEKLYSSIFSQIILDAEKYIGLSRDVSTLLMKKLADRFTALRKELKTAEESDEELVDDEPWIPFQYQHLPELSEKERHGLRYIGGYVYKKLYKKLKNSKEWKSPYCQMAMSFLEAGKDDDIEDSFLDDINRGGLWKVSPPAEHLFRIVEVIFCKNTSKKGLRAIHTDDMLLQCYRDHRVIQCCQSLLLGTEMEIEFKVAKDMIFGILTLYLRVRAFSKVRKILEEYKEKARVSAKEKGLRKDIKQKSGKQEN